MRLSCGAYTKQIYMFPISMLKVETLTSFFKVMAGLQTSALWLFFLWRFPFIYAITQKIFKVNLSNLASRYIRERAQSMLFCGLDRPLEDQWWSIL